VGPINNIKSATGKGVEDVVVKATASSEDMPRGPACLIEEGLDPCSLIIFGASGDLTARKIVPALFCLFVYGVLPPRTLILGCARSPMDDDSFRARMEAVVSSRPHYHPDKWAEFREMLFYQPIEYGSLDSLKAMEARLRRLEGRGHKRGRLLYLAIPPSIYRTSVEAIGKVGLAKPEGEHILWTRIVIEKPFGRDLESAIELDGLLHKFFREEQIFRIDHYLAKETVQNILMFRFANAIFEPIWNRQYIDQVAIFAMESGGVEHRAGYYEEAGVLRDMFQNHMMQLLALTAMEPPARFEADRVRDEKVKVYRELRPFPLEDLGSHLVLGQYTRAAVEGKEVPGYREEPGVAPDSLTPTYAKMKVFVDNWRWQGVPFYLTSGKRLAKKVTEIVVQFHRIPHTVFREVIGEEIAPNRLTLGIYPEEKITMTFQTKRPGARVCLRAVTMDFHYNEGYTGPVLESYEKVLLDCMLGDQMLFWRQDGVELAWAFLTPVLEECETCADRAQRLKFYRAGSWGPELPELREPPPAISSQ